MKQNRTGPEKNEEGESGASRFFETRRIHEDKAENGTCVVPKWLLFDWRFRVPCPISTKCLSFSFFYPIFFSSFLLMMNIMFSSEDCCKNLQVILV